MSEAVKIALLTSFANGLVTWGIVTTKLDWLRRDVDKLDSRIVHIEQKNARAEK